MWRDSFREKVIAAAVYLGGGDGVDEADLLKLLVGAAGHRHFPAHVLGVLVNLLHHHFQGLVVIVHRVLGVEFDVFLESAHLQRTLVTWPCKQQSRPAWVKKWPAWVKNDQNTINQNLELQMSTWSASLSSKMKRNGPRTTLKVNKEQNFFHFGPWSKVYLQLYRSIFHAHNGSRANFFCSSKLDAFRQGKLVILYLTCTECPLLKSVPKSRLTFCLNSNTLRTIDMMQISWLIDWLDEICCNQLIPGRFLQKLGQKCI